MEDLNNKHYHRSSDVECFITDFINEYLILPYSGSNTGVEYKVMETRREKVRMVIYKEMNHKMPHVHLNGSVDASISIINRDILSGSYSSLSRKTQKEINDYMITHEKELLLKWNELNKPVK